ncbi:TPA: pentapeptide repeat-containing protein [Klebsiella pneumoniae]|nr:pentapeptide repeat-containing protein [Klebsiella pneumoniae]
MNTVELRKILDDHKVWVESFRKRGSCADLCSAALRDADLLGADLRGAAIGGANLLGADLCGADLRDANLRGSNLCGAALRHASLLGAHLCGADLRDSDLLGADLCGADLRDADLPDLTFVIMGMEYAITITNGEYLQAGGMNHKIEDWRQFSKRDIAEMGGRRALKFYPRLLDVIDFYISKGSRPEWLNEPEADECAE